MDRRQFNLYYNTKDVYMTGQLIGVIKEGVK